ncbi:MAG: PD-(D/E)XK nuclease family protein, partial [Chloroflexota bacterium]
QVDDVLDFEERMSQGSYFHEVVHQHLVGIPAEILQGRIQDEAVAGWFATYLQTGLENVPERRYPEKTLTVPMGDYGLLAKIDLLAIGEKIQIIDWKTSRRVPKQTWLAGRLQTRVYRYVVVRGASHLHAGDIDPAQIEMVYWYADQNGETVRIPYSQEQYEADEQFLTELIAEIDARAGFPLTEDESRCKFCTYRSLCDRGQQAGSLAEWDAGDIDEVDIDDFEIDIDQIAEIAF